MTSSNDVSCVGKNLHNFTSYAPCRLCLFGEHQDYLDLPVIACAIPLYCTIRVRCYREHNEKPSKVNDGDVSRNWLCKSNYPDMNIIIRIQIPQLAKTREYDLQCLPCRQNSETDVLERDFALAAIYDAMDDGWEIDMRSLLQSMDTTDMTDDIIIIECISTSDMPMQAGCSTSSAFCVAFVQVLARFCILPQQQHDDNCLSPLDIARRAYHAEVVHFHAPGGNMDHVTSAMGGLIRIGGEYNRHNNIVQVERITKCKTNDEDKKWHVESLQGGFNSSNTLGVWVLAYSGEPKDTIGHLRRCKTARLELLEGKLGGDWDSLSSTNDDSLLTLDEQILLQATLTNRNVEVAASVILRETLSRSLDDDENDSTNGNLCNGEQLGDLMNQHHLALRDGLQLSTETLERIREAALNAGAWGFKLVGSGGGGCGIAWVPWVDPTIAAHVQRNMIAAGATETWIIKKPSNGAFIVDE